MKTLAPLQFITVPNGGQIAMMSRPRGGDWLQDELLQLCEQGVQGVVSLLTAEEVQNFELEQEIELGQQVGLAMWHYPIEDREVPVSTAEFQQIISELLQHLSAGSRLVIHCRQGIGRSAVVAAALLIHNGMDVDQALQRLSTARGVQVPETQGQKKWLDNYFKNHRLQSS